MNRSPFFGHKIIPMFPTDTHDYVKLLKVHILFSEKHGSMSIYVQTRRLHISKIYIAPVLTEFAETHV